MLHFIKDNRKKFIGLLIGVFLIIGGVIATGSSASASSAVKIVRVGLNSKGQPAFDVTADRTVDVFIGKKNTDVEPKVQSSGKKRHRIKVTIAKGNSNTWVAVVKDHKTGKQLAKKTSTWRNWKSLKSSCDQRTPLLEVTASGKSYGAFVKAKKGDDIIYRELIRLEQDGDVWSYGAVTLPKKYKVIGIAAQASGFSKLRCY